MPLPDYLITVPDALIRIDLVGESIGALISFLLMYYSYKSWRLSEQRSLALLFSGFLMIGFGLLIHVALLLLVPFLNIPPPYRPSSPFNPPSPGFAFSPGLILLLGNLLHWIIEGIGYLLISSAYLFQSRTQTATTTALQIAPISIALLTFNSTFDAFALVLLVAVLIQVLQTYLASRHRNTFYVVLGFLSLALAHVTFILFAFIEYSTTIYVLGHVLQLSGFLLLLFALTRKPPVT